MIIFFGPSVYPFIHSLNNHSHSIYYVLNTLLDTGERGSRKMTYFLPLGV